MCLVYFPEISAFPTINERKKCHQMKLSKMQKRGSVTIEVEDARQINQLCSLLHVTLLLFLVKKTGKAKLKRIKKNRKRTYVVSGLVYGNYGYSVSCFEGTQTSVC